MQNIYQHISIDLHRQATEEKYGNIHTLREWQRTLKEYNRYLDVRDHFHNDFDVSVAIKGIKGHSISSAIREDDPCQVRYICQAQPLRSYAAP